MQNSMKLSLKWLTGTALLAGLAWWIHSTVGWVELLRPWQSIAPLHLLLLVALTALSYLTRALRLYDLYSPRLGGAFSTYLRINVLHTTLLNLMPMRTGEIAFPIMMKRHFGQGYANSIANLSWLRVADLWILLWLGALVFAAGGETWLWLLVVLGGLLPLLVQPLRKRILHRVGDSDRRLAKFLRLLLEGLPHRQSRYLRLLGWTVLTWSLKLAAFVTVAGNFINAPALSLVPSVIAAEIASALPIQGVAGFGSYELAMVIGGAWSALSTETLLVAAVNLHLFILACTLLFGALALLLPVRK